MSCIARSALTPGARGKKAYGDVWVLLVIAVILIVFWIIGLIVHILGAFIHVLLVLAIIAAIIGFLTRNN